MSRKYGKDQYNVLTPTVCTKCSRSSIVADCNDSMAQPTCPNCGYAVIVCEILKSEFVIELEQLINKHSMENGSNTPDFILAHYLAGCLRSFNEAVNARTKWGAPPTLGSPAAPPIPMSQEELAK